MRRNLTGMKPKMHLKGQVLLILLLALLLSACCGGCKAAAVPKRQLWEARFYNWSSPSYPALMFEIRSNNTLYVLKVLRGRKVSHVFKLDNETHESLLSAMKTAFNELNQTTKIGNIADGINLEISFPGEIPDTAGLRN